MFLHHLRSELSKLFGKKRTYIGFGAFLIAQNLMLFALHISNFRRGMARSLEGNGYLVGDYVSALTVTIPMLIPQILLLMPLYVTLTGGDLVAKEAEDGTLRMILSRPISRFRLLFVKWVSGVLFCALLVLSLGAMALFFARLWFPWGGMAVILPIPVHIFNLMSPGEGVQHYVAAQGILAINACTMMSLAFMFSCFNMKPATATILALSFLLINLVLEGIPFFEDYYQYLLTHHMRSWLMIFAQPLPVARIAQSLCVLAGVNVTAFILGATAFQMRDIKS
jgi:ABC-2 type transport system permease protein